ncbi:hypothetical protein PENTCL1PPCAC_13589, partial [Pristionchus entomophagus]
LRLASGMDILTLPNVFLRDLMRRMTIKDRLSMRLTCSAFEKLVAGTHAGYFEKGSIFSFYETRCRRLLCKQHHVGDGDAQSATEFMQLRSRLFNGITFAKFELKVADSIPLEFTRNLIESFKIEELRFHVESQTQLEKAAALFSGFNRSKRGISLDYSPDSETLLSLPPMEQIEI